MVCKHGFQRQSDKHKILSKLLYQLKGYNARQLRTEFPNKGWTPCSIKTLLKKLRDTDTVNRPQGSDTPRSARMNENIDQVNDMVLSQEDQPELTVQSVKYHGRQAFVSGLLSALYKRIWSWNALRGDVRKSWLRRTALLVSYFWSFFSLPGTQSSFQMKRCSLWLQRWKNCENQLRFHQVKAIARM